MNVVKKQGFFKSLFSSTKVPEEYFSSGNTTMDNFREEQSSRPKRDFPFISSNDPLSLDYHSTWD